LQDVTPSLDYRIFEAGLAKGRFPAPQKNKEAPRKAHPAFCYRVKFRTLHISLRISDVIIPPNMREENRRGREESYEQSLGECNDISPFLESQGVFGIAQRIFYRSEA
jgi:hypothetical protein